ncbi:Trypsin domain containing protein [Trichuris trichiura]|uniref:Trypsin domain containing protein n=1 Tax=Trichuris trichiura TaxID=36087 RepID=A0A077ZAH1_TRITR|nr:Trypsin domain containing protein [Trichuris trichiura]
MAMLIAAAMIVHIVQSCGTPSIRPFKRPPKASSNRIVNGWEAKPHSLPWMVLIVVTYGQKFLTCSGFLIENGMKNETDIVLTASHCLHFEGKYQPPGNILVFLGVHNIKDAVYRTHRRTWNYVTHFTKSFGEENDIAMVRMVRPVVFSSRVSPLCLPEGEIPDMENKKCFAAGWGRTEQNTTSLVLKTTRLVFLPNDLCKSFVKIERELCVGQHYKDYNTCHGDSGSPLFCEIDDHYVAFGILSSGPVNCTENIPSSYTRLSAYRDWINSSMEELRKAPYQAEHTHEQGTLYIPKRTRLPGMLWSGGQQELIDGSSFIALLSGYHKRRPV